ncbi:hypothetical protein F5141DRAFT_216793 [Pisolithus sp. B1]|nr:hypothetical protein F5141DRAFT_216793 [Pisolithus sp. B1]
MDNSKNQNLCLVAAYLQGVCSDGRLVLWSSWSLNCSTVYVGYPESIPDDTAIPQWAYEDVTASGGYHATLVQAARDSFEGTAILDSSEETTIFYSSEGITILGGTTIVASTLYASVLGPSPTPSPSSSAMSTSLPSSSASPAPSTSPSVSPAPSTSSSAPSTPTPSSSTSSTSSPSSSTSSTSSLSSSKSSNVGTIVGSVGGAVGLVVIAFVARSWFVGRPGSKQHQMPDATRDIE